MASDRLATRITIFTRLGHAPKLLRWLVCITAFAACAPGDGERDSEPVASVAQALVGGPGVPAILRDVHLIENPTGAASDVHYTYPIIPPFRTSADGRVGVDMASGKLFLFSPEELDYPVMAPGADTGPQIVIDALAFPTDDLTTEEDDFYRTRSRVRHYAAILRRAGMFAGRSEGGVVPQSLASHA